MDSLNTKVISGQEELRYNTQNVGLYGYDASTNNGTWRRLVCDSEGKQKIEATLELDSSTLAKEAKQDDIINATNRAINNTGGIGDGSVNATTVCLGYDRSNGQGRSLLVNSAGELMVNLGSATTQNVNCLGNESGDGSGAIKHLHLDGSGNVQANVVNTINIAPANTVNSHITDDPANSVAVGLKARTTIGTATTEQFLLCDSDGHLQADIVNTANVKFEDISSSLNSGTANDPPNSLAVGLRARTDIADSSTETFLKCDATGVLQTSGSGGGSSASNQYNNGGTEETLTVVKPTAPATGNITPATVILDLQNYKGVSFNVKTTSAGYTALSMGVEFSNASDFSTTLGIGYNDIQIFDVPTDVGGNPISGQYQASILMIPEHNSQQPLAQYARLTFNHSNNAGTNVSVVINSTQIPH